MQLPTQFGPYLLLERISVGGMAEVYKAKEYGVDGFERTVAIKRILPHVAEDEEFIAMFKDEAKIAVQLNHGNIAQIYNLGNVQDSFYIALEYVNGRDLRAIFQKCQQQGKPMPVSQACYVIMKICEGLDYAHNKKNKEQQELHIVHRDVSPPNILVSFEGEVKLIDFGVAKAAGRASRTQAGILKGKFGYMSPEQVRGVSLDRRSDVFAVGVVLFEMLCGQRLFQAETDFATLEKVRAVDVPRPSSLNPDIQKPLENIIYKALAREPEQRYQSSIELHDELQAFMFAQGLFYSRKDLAAWMRQQYAREIELEKEKDRAQASIRPDTLPTRELPRRQRKTMMMSGGGPPPPPTGTASRKAAPPPPPRPGGPGRTAASAAAPPPAAAKNKRKTMVMTTSRPNLPTPGRGRGTDVGDVPTLPAGEALPSGGARPLASAAKARAPAADPFGELDWDDEELETRLFEGDNDAAVRPADDRVTAAVPLTAERAAQIGGAIATDPGAVSPQAPPRSASVTVVPPSNATMVPGAYNRTVMPMGNPLTVVPGYAGGYPTVVPPGMPVNAGLPAGATGRTQALPIVARPIVDFGERHVGKRSSLSGPVVAILLGAFVLFGVGVIGTAIVLGARNRVPARAEVQPLPVEGLSAAPASILPIEPRGAMTLETLPAGAIVAIDGNSVGGTSPFVISDLEFGKHVLSIAGPGYLPLEREVVISASPLSLRVNLQRRDVALALESDPPTAKFELIVNGNVTSVGASGRTFTVSRDPAAIYEIEVSNRGYQTQRLRIEFTGEGQQPVRVALVREPSVGAVAAIEGPANGATPADGPGAQSTPPSRPTNDTASSKPVHPPKPSSTSSGSSGASKSTRPSTDGRSTGTTSGSSKQTRPSTPVPKTPAKTATLRIGTTAGVVPATVFVDGELKGQTPLPNVMVTPGRHTVKYKWPDGREIKKTVSVTDGEVEIVKAG